MRWLGLLFYCAFCCSAAFAADSDTVKVYRTLSKPGEERPLTPRQNAVTQLIEAGGMAVSVNMTLALAKEAYASDPNGCITMFIDSIDSNEIESKSVSLFPIWLYVRADFQGDALSNLRTVGTYAGGNFERYLPLIRGAEWKFAPSFEALLLQVKSRELDAATFGEAGVRDLLANDPEVRPLTAEPFGFIASHVRCKNTPLAKAFLADLDTRLDAVKIAQ